MTRVRIDLRPDEWMTQERLESVLARIDVDAAGCWHWTGATNRNGYGILAIPPRGRSATVHRVLYALLREYVPVDLDLDHLCRVRHCVNPDHLEAVTHQINCGRSTIAEVQRARMAAITHCVRGHDLNDAANVLLNAKGWRCCRVCNTERARARRRAAVA